MSSPAIPLTETRDLRTGTVPWRATDWRAPNSGSIPTAPVDVAILGSGIMGSILADRLAASGRSVAICDRRVPGTGSTAASTAQLMWAMDVPLAVLSERLGEKEAARRWLRVFAAVERFGRRLDEAGGDLKQDVPTLYLEGKLLEGGALAQEAALHRRHGLPSRYLSAPQVAGRFAIAPRAGIVSSGTFAMDPVRTCHALLARAQAREACLVYPIDIASLHPNAHGIELASSDGRSFTARDVILATGYERARLFLPEAFSLLSTFAIATPPHAVPLWNERAMIWEASDPYLYVRVGPEGRIIAGGEDVELADADTRDELLAAKAGAISARLAKALGQESIAWDRAWAATFGNSPDGLPAIGAARGMDHLWLASGFGGNGIAFAALAAELLAAAICGTPDDDAECFDPYRFEA
ncbi:FAD-binding oxidoreductase [Novosphingobium sp. KA1]|uniref:NAD(P)/FAD-dependent oxidoreductase n=1 Tax=Novosphingobium sp. (strain KA1) TaxID=164608 RepID=UPI001A8E427D|nr:FAD-binding oxidoreductase [Novosphingobium sp. KA1]